MVAEAKASGGRVHCPNGLPIRCVTRDNLMIENEHGDHPDYKFPVLVLFTDDLTEDNYYDYRLLVEDGEPTEENVRKFCSEDHALIYTDGSIAMTMYECNYYVFSLRDGQMIMAPKWQRRTTYCLDDESLQKVKQLSQQRSVKTFP